MNVKRTYRINDHLADDLTNMAKEENMSENLLVETAMRYYRDYYYMQKKATVINKDILKLSNAACDLLEQRINNKTNQILSELSIQVCTMAQIIAGSLEVDPLMIPEYRKKAVAFLKANNRVLRLDEIVE